jgi:exonuclease VII large subunit
VRSVRQRPTEIPGLLSNECAASGISITLPNIPVSTSDTLAQRPDFAIVCMEGYSVRLLLWKLQQQMSQLGTFTVEALNQQLRATVIGVLHYGFKANQRQVTVQGQIGEIKPTQYRYHYKVKLKGDTGQTIYLDIDKEIAARSRVVAGDYVEVVGCLSVDEGQSQTSKVDIRIEVSALTRIGYPQTFEREERATLEFLKTLGYRRSNLPNIDDLRLSLIHPQSESARVQDDFLVQIAQVQDLIRLERIPVAMNRAEAIAEAIERAAGSLLVLIRGGGESTVFEVFDDKLVLQAWSSKQAFKAVGLGHEGTGASLIEFVSEYVGSTPTAVGVFLAQQITSMKWERDEALANQAHLAQLDEQNQSLRAQITMTEERKKLAVQEAVTAGEQKRERLLMIAAFVVGFALIIGGVLGYRFAR